MKLIKWIFAVGMSLAFGAAASTQQKKEVAQQDWVFDGCDEIKALQEGKTTVIGGGSVTFTGDIECGDMAVRVQPTVGGRIVWRVEGEPRCGCGFCG